MNDFELIDALANQSILDIIASNIERFYIETHCKPELVTLCYRLRTSLTIELIKLAKLDPEDAIAVPIWFDGIPIVFGIATGENLLVLTNKAIKKELCI